MSNLPNLIIDFCCHWNDVATETAGYVPMETLVTFVLLLLGNPGTLENRNHFESNLVWSHIVFTYLELGLMVQKGDIYLEKTSPLDHLTWGFLGSMGKFYLTYRPHNKALLRAYHWFPLISPAINPYFWGGVYTRGVRLTTAMKKPTITWRSLASQMTDSRASEGEYPPQQAL